MYKTSLTKRQLSALRAEGFIHVTGMSYIPCYESSGGREFYFPESQRGRWAEREGFILAVLWNGEVWMRYSDKNVRYKEDEEDTPLLIEIPTKLLNETLGLTRVSFSVFGRRGIEEDSLTDGSFLEEVYPRIANPYYGVRYSNDPNPNQPRKRKKGKRRKPNEVDFLGDEFLPGKF